jgi:acyl-CoA dehydrogenase
MNGDYILNGEKWLISHTDCCQFAYVIACTDPSATGDERLSAFFVPCDSPGYEVIPMPPMMGARGVGHSGLKFTDLHLDKKYLLGKEGQGMDIAIHSLSISRAHIAASNLGMCQRMLEISLKRAQDRVTFGKAIATRQMIKREIAEMQTYTHALRTLVYDFGQEYDADSRSRFIEEKAAICKLFSIYAVRIVSDAMLEIFGGDGYFEDCPYGPVERLYRDARAMWLEEGTSSVQRITIARNCLAFGGALDCQSVI